MIDTTFCSLSRSGSSLSLPNFNPVFYLGSKEHNPGGFKILELFQSRYSKIIARSQASILQSIITCDVSTVAFRRLVLRLQIQLCPKAITTLTFENPKRKLQFHSFPATPFTHSHTSAYPRTLSRAKNTTLIIIAPRTKPYLRQSQLSHTLPFLTHHS